MTKCEKNPTLSSGLSCLGDTRISNWTRYHSKAGNLSSDLLVRSFYTIFFHEEKEDKTYNGISICDAIYEWKTPITQTAIKRTKLPLESCLQELSKKPGPAYKTLNQKSYFRSYNWFHFRENWRQSVQASLSFLPHGYKELTPSQPIRSRNRLKRSSDYSLPLYSFSQTVMGFTPLRSIWLVLREQRLPWSDRKPRTATEYSLIDMQRICRSHQTPWV